MGTTNTTNYTVLYFTYFICVAGTQYEIPSGIYKKNGNMVGRLKTC